MRLPTILRKASSNIGGPLSAWVGRIVGLRDGGFWRVWFESDTYTKESVTAETALTVSAFWAAVRLLATTVGSLPAGVYVRLREGEDRVLARDHPLYDVVHNSPNAKMTAMEFWEAVIAHLLLFGNFVAEKQTNSLGQVIGLRPLWWGGLRIDAKDGRLTYEYQVNNQVERFSAEQVLHIRGFSIGGDLGLPVLHYARQSLGLALATDRTAGTTFANGMRPGGFFTYDKTLTDEQRADATRTLVTPLQGGNNAGKIGILEAGFKWQDVQLSPEEAQMLQTRGFNVEEVCRWVGVPPIMIGHASTGQTMWGSGISEILTAFYTLGLRPLLTRIEQAVKRDCLTPADRAKGVYMEFNFEALLRADSKARAEFYAMMVQNGLMTRNEARAKENLPRQEGGDALTAQVNLAPLTTLGAGATPNAEAVRSALLVLLKAGTETGGQTHVPAAASA